MAKGATAPPARLLRGSGTTRSGSRPGTRPKPWQVSQAPTELLKEKRAGVARAKRALRQFAQQRVQIEATTEAVQEQGVRLEENERRLNEVELTVNRLNGRRGAKAAKNSCCSVQ